MKDNNDCGKIVCLYFESFDNSNQKSKVTVFFIFIYFNNFVMLEIEEREEERGEEESEEEEEESFVLNLIPLLCKHKKVKEFP